MTSTQMTISAFLLLATGVFQIARRGMIEQCEFCEKPANIHLHADQLFENTIVVRDRYCCDDHLIKTHKLMHLDGFKGWTITREETKC
jgi:hypothetical protein